MLHRNLVNAFVFVLSFYQMEVKSQGSNIICNPLNLEYRFMIKEPSRREAADPTIVLFKDKYLLFASKSGGFWVSDDLVKWVFHTNKQLPWEDYAPTAVVINDSLYFMASGKKIYRTDNPINGYWEQCGEIDFSVIDPCLFYENEKLYLLFGASAKEPLKMVELEKNNHFKFKNEPSPVIYGNPQEHGFERPGNNNEANGNPWIEGGWLTKYHNRYYLQYAAPGTQFNSYSDGCYVSDSIFGPYNYQSSNPVSSKPSGLINGAGHGCTFKDKNGNYWHVATASVSIKHPFERRICIFPASFDKNDVLSVNTSFGDYPLVIPEKKINPSTSQKTLYNLLSFAKKVTASSTLDSVKTKVDNVVDENIRTWWSAKSSRDEWIKVDLGETATVNACQLNFNDEGTALLGTTPELKSNKYAILYSLDENRWDTAFNYINATTADKPHPFHLFQKPIKARYLLVNIKEVSDGLIALSDIRIFGKMNVPLPKPVKKILLTRNSTDARSISLKWETQSVATGYEIIYGRTPNELYHSYMVHKNNEATINSLNLKDSYYFTIRAFNEAGVGELADLQKVE